MSTRLRKKEEKLIYDCYRELYKKSTPSGDFDELVSNATINDFGQKEIPFKDYEIDDTLLHKIIDKYAKKFKYKWRQEAFRNTILLGCSPKSINVK